MTNFGYVITGMLQKIRITDNPLCSWIINVALDPSISLFWWTLLKKFESISHSVVILLLLSAFSFATISVLNIPIVVLATLVATIDLGISSGFKGTATVSA